MKKKADWIMIVLSLLFSSVIFGFFYKNFNSTKKTESNISAFTDSINYLKYQKTYLTDLLNVATIENGHTYKFDSTKVFDLRDREKQFFKLFCAMCKTKKEHLVVRYTEIGCDACSDSTFRYMKKYAKLDSMFDIIVLVDFTNYDSYLKWRKISEISCPIFWVKKGDLPFAIEEENASYIFTVNSALQVSNFFLPNSRFSNYIKNYFEKLELK